MNPQQTSIKHSALGWVKKSIDDNLIEIKTDLKCFIEDGDESLLALVRDRLTVIHGVLVMVEQYGAAMLAEEMVSLCVFLIESDDDKNEQAVEILLRAVLQLPDYLEHIQSGNIDIPMAILPLLNDIRTVKKQDLFSEKLLFLPDLSMHQDDIELDAIDDRSNNASKLWAKKLRPVYQYTLLKLIQDESLEANLKRMGKVCETMEEHSFSEQVARVWWIIGALVESVSRQQLELGVSIKSLLGKVDAMFRVVIIVGERGLLKRQPIDLIKNVLYYIAQPECDGPKAQAIKTAYRLEQFLPSETVRNQVLNHIAGPNQALLKTVAENMKTDIEAVKSTLEVYVNGDLSNIEILQELPRDMHVISDTLAMIGLGQQRQLVESQIATLQKIVDGEVQADEDKLLAMAAELIHVEQALGVMQRRQTLDESTSGSPDDASRGYELDNVLFAVVTAALDNIQKTKAAILEFIKDSTRSENIDLCITLMEEARGALILLNKDQAVAIVDGLLEYMRKHDLAEFMETDRLDAMSQVVVSVEYYLEALGERRSDSGSILDYAGLKLEELLTPAPKPVEEGSEDALIILDEAGDAEPLELSAEYEGIAESAASEEIGSDISDDTELELQDNPDLDFSAQEPEVEPIVAADIEYDEEVVTSDDDPRGEPVLEIEQDDSQIVNEISNDLEDLHVVLKTSAEDDEPLVTPPELDSFTAESPAVTPGSLDVIPVEEDLEVLKPDSDPEILEIYLEEAEEESENIARMQQDWLLHPEDENALANIRRSFHTIKGSGRLVGASKIGEFAWDYEQLLNRVMDKTVPANDEVIAAVGLAAIAIRELVSELTTEQPPASDIAYLRGLARALAEFKADQVIAGRAEQAQIAESPHDHITGHDDEKDSAVTGAEVGVEIDAVEGENFEVELEDVRHEAPGAEEVAGDSLADDIELLTEPSLEIELLASDALPLEEGPLAEPGAMSTGAESSLESPPLDSDPTGGEVESEDAGLVSADDDEYLVDSSIEGVPPGPFAVATPDTLPGNEAEANLSGSPEPVGSIDLSFDPELLTIYQQEVDQHLNTVNSALEEAESKGELIPGEDLYRALHTIHGASRTADIHSIGELAGLMEKPVKMALAQAMALDHEIVSVYRHGYHALHDMTAKLVDSRQLPAIPEALKISFQTLAEDIEEHTVEIPDTEAQVEEGFVDTLTMMSDAVEQEQDDELLAIFTDEANELLEMSDQTLYQWSEIKDDPSIGQDYSLVMELQRYLHTLKGGARMAGLTDIGNLSHELESMFIAVIDNRVEKNDDLVDVLKDSFDLLHEQIVQAEQGKPLSKSDRQVKLLKTILTGSAPPEVEETLPKPVTPEKDKTDLSVDTSKAKSGSEIERQSQEIIRVRSDLLDNLVNSAGEVSIYRARMEQQVSGLGSYLGELGQTILRLKNQLRSLEAETDAQIHFSHRDDASTAGEFDPLEMDRYTLIQELSKSLSESVNDLSSLQGMLGEQVKDSETLLLQQSRVNTDLQDGLIKSRMVKFSGLLSRLRRLVRQSSQELAKKAELVVSGEDNEVDTKVLDRMVAPLEHIIRNAISHGIEKPVERVKNGKPETGVISIDIRRDGPDIVIKVSDDGGGVNIDKVRSRALQLGLIDNNQKVSDTDLIQYILEPGFSTAEQVTQSSGRGVGMDVVGVEIKQLGGTLQIETSPAGSTFIARLPFTLSINQAILVRAGEEVYAIPLINIEGITRLETSQLVEQYQSNTPELEYDRQRFSLHYLAKLVGAADEYEAEEGASKEPVILSRSGDVRIALHVDEIIGNREIVVKSLGKQLSQVKGLSGASILADGSVVLILEVNGLARNAMAGAVRIVYKSDQDGIESKAKTRNIVMVVDDSITMRRVASKLLERHNYQVVTAKDGVDALAQLEEVQPDVMLLDIEMPRMDGFELAKHMRSDEVLTNIPIIMITSRTGEKHRERAYEIGVANYMGKPYQEGELIENIQLALDGK